MSKLSIIAIVLLAVVASTEAFSVRPSYISDVRVCTRTNSPIRNSIAQTLLQMSDKRNDGVVELVDEEETAKDAAVSNTPAPFLSQGEIAEDVLNPDLSDPKQTRVIIYIVLSLVPVLFLIPLMLGSRDLIPLDALPPVAM
mmetsp:Transcript_3841/g.5778  ORF Transcript_3841/g.5778 Transcript_3841/m.5778 type:complete len:141 (+) Transcript_3841:66-488(+)